MASTAHRDDYKHSKEAFVSGMTGSTVSHVNMITLIVLVCLRPLLLHAGSLTMQLQGLYCITFRHPLTLVATEIFSLPFRMATPRCPSAPLNDPFRSSPRHTIRHLVSSHRVHMFPLPATPVWYTSTLRRSRLSSCVIRVASRAGFFSRQVLSAMGGIDRTD